MPTVTTKNLVILRRHNNQEHSATELQNDGSCFIEPISYGRAIDRIAITARWHSKREGENTSQFWL